MRVEFKFGDVLPAKDPIARWIVKLAMINNDLVYANNGLLAAQKGTVEWFYWWRYAIAHYHEAMNCLKEEHNIPEVADFVGGMSETARNLHDAALEIHAELVSHASRIRNETTFHYPGDQAKQALTAALEDLAPNTGVIETRESNKVRDARFNYADDVVATLVVRAMGGDDGKVEEASGRLAEGEKALMQFINHAQDEYFVGAFERGMTDISPNEEASCHSAPL